MCPTPNCGGAGFTFDIFPTDEAHPANDGWTYYDDEEGDEEFDEEIKDWQPGESDEEEFDDDLEGEEWKYGLQPGEAPPEPEWAAEARKKWEEEKKQYDEPDLRPRIIDWSEREDRTPKGQGGSGGSQFSEDDIPF